MLQGQIGVGGTGSEAMYVVVYASLAVIHDFDGCIEARAF